MVFLTAFVFTPKAAGRLNGGFVHGFQFANKPTNELTAIHDKCHQDMLLVVILFISVFFYHYLVIFYRFGRMRANDRILPDPSRT